MPRFLSPIRVALCAVLAFPVALRADDLPAPSGEVLLTITGDIARTNGKGAARFDRDMLAAMDPVTFRTETIWTDGPQTFTGPTLSALLDHVSAEGATVTATAINDYAVTIPQEDRVATGPIVAYLRNGAPMSVRDKGPLWIVYPYDSDPAYRTEVIYARSIWQLDRLDVGR
ncbi:hypothetical protein SAMN04490244_101410 [Tranquillimonas rosea]|uniref:Oxidoreductase molybdopterin-binding domain-containing protein n=1 Tax=Tranquillimonas rosea TaxID=641238 RepID=A0A1H9Q0P2_9RHOB|nr:oxidoreductase [Tranquillimonas rosea]SER53635.1 hypothetical protein SAMN04490244_101410 [Tranquillimonas rosea]